MGLASYILEKFGRGVNVKAWYDDTTDVHTPVVLLANPASIYGAAVDFVSVAQGGAGTTALKAADASNKHKVLGCVLILGGAGTLKFTDGVSDLTGAMDIAANGGFVLPAGVFPYVQTGAVNRALNIVTTGGAAKGVVITLTEP